MDSLELNWVRNEDKSLLVPPVVFESRNDCSGYYVHPAKGEYEIDGKFYDTARGVIVVSPNVPENIPSIIAHEWRHHWQFYHGWKYDGIGWNCPDDYEKAICDYFLSSKCEFDALRFELSKAKNDLTDYWRGLIYRRKSDGESIYQFQ